MLFVGTLLFAQPARATAPDKLSLVVSPHPDDEMMAWSLIENSPDNYRVLVFATLGEQTGACTTTNWWEAGTGEREPGTPYPQGKWTDACENERINSTLRFLNQMNDTDSSLPSDMVLSEFEWKGPFPSNGVSLRRCDTSCYNADRRARVYDGGSYGTVIFFDLGDGDLTQSEVEWLVVTVIANRATLGIPNLPWHNLIGAAFNHTGAYANCVTYNHADHRAVHEALWSRDFTGIGYQVAPTCQTDPDQSRHEVADHFSDAFQMNGTTRIGAHVVQYGWLKDNWWIGDYTGQGQIFHMHQYFWSRF